MIKLECQCCGANLKRKGNILKCDFCGSEFVLNANDKIESSIVTDNRILNLYIKAAGFMLKGNHTEELQALTEALEIDSDNVTTLIKLGRCYRTLGFKDKAVEMYNAALEIDPTDGTAYTNLGVISIFNEDFNGAVQYFEKGLPLIDKNTEDYWVSYANYAICIAKIGNKSKAKQMIKEAERHGYKNGDECRKLAGLKNSKASNVGDIVEFILDAIGDVLDIFDIFDID